MPDFFSYSKHIVDALTEAGYSVDYFSDRPSTNNFIKALIRLNKKMVFGIIKRYKQKILNAIKKTNYEKMIMILGQSFDEKFIKDVREINPNMELVYYAWDSIENYPFVDKLGACFDRSFTSDLTDSLNFPHLHFLPLFYSKTYEEIGTATDKNFSYDTLFVGTIKNGKYTPLNNLLGSFEKLFENNYKYMYLQSRLVYFYSKIRYDDFKGSKMGEFNYKKMSEDKLASLFKLSRIIIDIPAGNQSGLTMRTFETLGAKRKLITTNEEIKKYDFYNPANIYVYTQGDIIDLNASFFTEEYHELDKTIYEKYSLRSWLKTILGHNE